MKKILLFAGSNSSTSINRTLIEYTLGLIEGFELNHIDLRDFDIPMFSQDLEKSEGLPQGILELLKLIDEADGIIISTPEHNAMMPAFFKNVIDWLSRITLHLERTEKYLNDKKLFIMSTSAGRGGAAKSLALLKMLVDRGDGEVVAEFSLPSYNHTSNDGVITDAELKEQHQEQLRHFLEVIS
ncbi:NAD(P)H-dependent oxidoreductase [Paracrocinitomix mangrovi]|uniref:NADPH-dependent FMN reductase n=1 Tax=Paracrocinitomix mangrovi TaxID=2862509 RepID=UPI001C8D2898|nr:NAD(P)H-dependent oxidoreductase [Paracrocinitomix mangrovi]UKN02298.1 NAD(P)H-dependent oxidoreductase [Paracrocinitomix mangrovi]